MPIPTAAEHARNLFHLTMETQHGPSWRTMSGPATIVAIADEIVRGFGASAESPTHEESRSLGKATLWRFGDGSLVRTGAFGLEILAATEAA